MGECSRVLRILEDEFVDIISLHKGINDRREYSVSKDREDCDTPMNRRRKMHVFRCQTAVQSLVNSPMIDTFFSSYYQQCDSFMMVNVEVSDGTEGEFN